VVPLLLGAAGVVALGIAVVVLRSFGPRYRVGRLLAATPAVSVADAVRLAEADQAHYVRIDGRIDSEAEFEDADHRPLVLRRRTLRWRPGGRRGRWTTFESTTEAVPFVIREGLDEIGVEGDDLDDGLIVVPRVSQGRAADLGERAPAGAALDAEAALSIEQVSSVEHATVIGVPRLGADGRAMIGQGLGRPLILTTLERDEAMRLLAGGATGRSRLAIACLAAGATLVGVASIWWLLEQLVGGGATAALAASPDPTQRPGSDTRTTGQAPGFVGEPLLAVLGMLGIGLASLVASLTWIRLTGGPRQPPGDSNGAARLRSGGRRPPRN
jgi:hypothetical protein